MDCPKVSVFIAAYNHARFLPACLDSVLAQTYRDFEVVVVDDGSSDGSHDVLMDYQCRFSDRIRYLWHADHGNRGISASCNLAISNSKGRYLAWIGSDDMWYPDTLERQVARLDADPGLGLVYGYAHFIDNSGNRLPGMCGVDITADANPLARMLECCHPPAMTVMFRRRCLEDVGPFDEGLVYSDWELWIRILAHWKAGFIDRALAMYRLHGHNLSKGIDPQVDLRRTLEMMCAVRKKAGSIGGSLAEPRNLATVDLQLAFLHFCSGRENEAARNLYGAFEDDPSLRDDVAFINDWLNRWKGGFYSPSLRHFGLWLIANLPPECSQNSRRRLTDMQLAAESCKTFFIRRGIERGRLLGGKNGAEGIFEDCPAEVRIPKSWKLTVLGEVYASLLFEAAASGDSHRARLYWVKAVRRKPGLLLNRGVWAVGFRAIRAVRSSQHAATGSRTRRGEVDSQ